MDDAYSILLAVSLLLAVAALLSGVGSRMKSLVRLSKVSRIASFFALAIGLASALVHWFGGHGPGTPSALSLSAFLSEHPALLAVAGLSITALWLSRLR